MTGCQSLGTLQHSVNDAAKAVDTYAQNHPAMDTVSDHGISTLALLLYSIGSTLGLFITNKKSKNRKDALEETFSQENGPKVESLKSSTTRKVVREALKK